MKTFLVLVFCLLVIVHVCDGSTHRSKKQSLDECNRISRECGGNCFGAERHNNCLYVCNHNFKKCKESLGLEEKPNDPWTRTASGCLCKFDKDSTDCACCVFGGCQCPIDSRHQCVQCGWLGQCGNGQSIDRWTRTASGCSCYFDEDSTDCACCKSGGCQCPLSNLHQCVQCGQGDQCGKDWTRTPTGCSCYFDKDRKDCACCNDGGCQCPLANLHQCVQCNHGDQCGIGVPALDVDVKVGDIVEAQFE